MFKKLFSTFALFLSVPPARVSAEPIDKPFAAVQTTPDFPQPFGFKMQWLAIKSENPQDVIEALPTKHIQIANWASGIHAVYDYLDQSSHSQQAIFVTPSIQGWTLLASHNGIPYLDQSDADNMAAFELFTAPLLSKFNDVQYFGSYRVIDYVSWAKAENGKWQRRFSYNGSNGTVFNEGPQTEAEKSLGLPTLESTHALNDEKLFTEWISSHDEETPLLLAGKWSINPSTLETTYPYLSAGWLIDIDTPVKVTD